MEEKSFIGAGAEPGLPRFPPSMIHSTRRTLFARTCASARSAKLSLQMRATSVLPGGRADGHTSSWYRQRYPAGTAHRPQGGSPQFHIAQITLQCTWAFRAAAITTASRRFGLKLSEGSGARSLRAELMGYPGSGHIRAYASKREYIKTIPLLAKSALRYRADGLKRFLIYVGCRRPCQQAREIMLVCVLSVPGLPAPVHSSRGYVRVSAN